MAGAHSSPERALCLGYAAALTTVVPGTRHEGATARRRAEAPRLVGGVGLRAGVVLGAPTRQVEAELPGDFGGDQGKERVAEAGDHDTQQREGDAEQDGAVGGADGHRRQAERGHGWRKAEVIEAFYKSVDAFLRQAVVFR